MTHKWTICLLAGFAAMAFASCDNGRDADDRIPDIGDFVEGENHNILVAYFSEPLPESGADAVTSASRVTVDGEIYGSVQYMATVIADATGGDIIKCCCSGIFFRVKGIPFAADIPVGRYSAFDAYSRTGKYDKFLPEQRLFQFRQIVIFQ